MNLALYLNDKIPGMTIPDAIMKRLADAGDKVAEESIEITAENYPQAERQERGQRRAYHAAWMGGCSASDH